MISVKMFMRGMMMMALAMVVFGLGLVDMAMIVINHLGHGHVGVVADADGLGDCCKSESEGKSGLHFVFCLLILSFRFRLYQLFI